MSELAAAPLSVANVTPNNGSSGTAVTIRISGFQNGAVVKFATTQVAASVVDNMTITTSIPQLSSGPVQVTVINPDGTHYSFDAAFQVN